MKPNQQHESSQLRNDRSIWLAVASIISTCALVSTAGAASITDSALAPSGNILASQLGVLGPGVEEGSRNFTDNGGPAGQTFTVSSTSMLDRITVLGRGNSAGSWNNGAQPFAGTEVWGIQLALVNDLDGSLIVLGEETATGFSAPANLTTYLTFTLGTPVQVDPGFTYAFSIVNAAPSWFGLAHSDTDVYAGGTAINNNSSIANPGGNAGGPRYTFVGNGFAAPNPNNYDYVFAVQSVPEPGTVSLLGLGALGLVFANKRRRA